MLCYSVGVGVGVMRVSGRCFVALLARRVHKDCELYLGPVVVAWAVPGGFMKVGLGLLHVVCGINVASRWGCAQGVCEQCRCWSLGMGNRVSSVGRWD